MPARSINRKIDPLQAAVARAARACIVEVLERRQLLTTYYVSTSGNDMNPGTSSSPWASVQKVDSTSFQPGDQILFQRGGEWHGVLEASSNGTAGNPIVYGAYGNTSLPKPIFDGSDYLNPSTLTSLGNGVYSFPTSAVPNGVAYWVYVDPTVSTTPGAFNQNIPLLAAQGGGASMPADSFYVNGSTVYINLTGANPASPGAVVNPAAATTAISVGDRAFETNPTTGVDQTPTSNTGSNPGQDQTQGEIISDGHSYVTFDSLIGRETAEVPNGGTITSQNFIDGYVFRAMAGNNVTFSNDDAYYGGKHIVGAIDTTAFSLSNSTAQGAVNGVSGNQLGYGNATAVVAYSDQNRNGDTYSFTNDTVSNYSGSQPAFLTHGNDNSIASILLQNFVALNSPIAIQPSAGLNFQMIGGEVTNNVITSYQTTGGSELFNGVTLTGPASSIQIYGGATVENSLFAGSAQSGEAIQVSGSGNVVRFNTIDPPGYASGLALDGGSSNTTIYGNIFTGSGSDLVSNGNSYTADYDFFDSSAGTPNLTEAHGIVGNPSFVSAAGGNFALQSNSGAINQIPTSAPLPGLSSETNDILGSVRPNSGAYDMGAFEYLGTLHQPTVATAASANPSTVTGTTTALSALGASPDGEATLTYTWAAGGPGAVTYSSNGNNSSKNTTATFSAAGNYTFTVTISNGTYSTTSSTNVTVQQVSQGLTIAPSQWYVSTGTTKQFTASVKDQFGNTISGPSITYSIQSGGGSISNTGLFTPPSTSGSTTIISATSGGLTATATANIVPPNQAPTVATAASSNPNPVSGTTAQLSVLGADDNGEGNLTYSWSLTGSSNPGPVTFSTNNSNAAKNTTVTFTSGNGQYNFLVTITDQGGLSTTSSVTVNVSTFNPVTLDGNLDGRYGSPITVQSQATNLGNGNLGSPAAPYSQLAAGYGVIDAQSGTFDLFLAGSLNLSNANLDLLIDSVPGQGVSNLNSLNNVGPFGNGTFSTVVLDNGFRPDHIFSFSGDGGDYLDYNNLDTNTEAPNEYLGNPATGTTTSTGSVPYFQERVNNSASSTQIAAGQGGSVTTGAEFVFSLAGLGYTTANYNANVPINVMAMISFGSHTEMSNQVLAPYTPNPSVTASNAGFYMYYGNGFDFSNNTEFAGNQFFAVTPPAAPAGPTVATAASASPSSVTSGNSTNLSVLGADSSGESSLIYTWQTTGTPPAAVTFSANGTNASKNTTATFTANGTYNFLVTIKDPSNYTTTSTVTVNVSGISAGSGPTVTTAASASPSTVTGTSTALSVAASDPLGASSLSYSWAATTIPSGAASPAFSTNNSNSANNTTATFSAAGNYTFTVTITDTGGKSTTSTVNVTVNQTATTVTISPTTVSVVSGMTQQFTGLLKDQFGNTIGSPSFTWSVPSGGGTVSASGLYTAPAAAGSATVKVVSGSLSATANITITNSAPTVATAASASPNPVTGTTANLAVLGADDGGESKLTYTWSTTGTPPAAVNFSANGTNASKNTVATFTKAGAYSFQVLIKDAAGLTTTSTVNVTVNQTATTVTLTPATVTVAPSATQQFTAAVKDQFGAAISSPAITWSVASGSGTINTSGLYTAGTSAGSATVKAVSGSASGTASVTVSAANQPPTVATAAKATPSPVTGTTTALSVLGADDGGESNLIYQWATTGTPPAAVTFSVNGTNASKNTTATFTKAGSYSFQVTIKDSGGLTTTSSVTVVVNQTATTVTVSPSTASVAANGTKQFTAAVADQFGAAIASPAITWSVASGSGSISTGGLYTAGASAGSATVKAVSGSASGTAAVTVTAGSGSAVTVDGTLDSSYGSPIVIQSQATNYGNGAYTGPGGAGASAPYSQLSAAYLKLDPTNNQLDLFIAGSANLTNAHLDLFIDSVPGAGVNNLSSLSGNSFYTAGGFPSIVFDNGFQPDHLISFSGDAGMYVNYTNLDTGAYSAYSEADPASGPVTSAVSGVPAYTIAVNNAQQNNVIAAGAGGSVTTGIEIAFNLSSLGYTTANFNAGVPINVEAMISYGTHTIGTNQILAPYTPNASELQRDGGVYTYFGSGNFNFSNNTRFAGNQFFSVNPPAVTVDGTLDPRYGTADVIQSQATNFGNAGYTGPGGSGATAPYSQLSAAYTIVDEAHNQLDLFIAGSANLSNAHLDLFIDSVPGAGVANLNSLSSNSFYNAGGFPSIIFDNGFRPDHLISFSGDAGMYVNYTNLDTGAYSAYSEADPASGPVTSAVSGVPGYTIAVNNAQQNNIIAAGAGGSVTTGIEIAFNLAGLGYTPAMFSSGTPINIEALISYGSHTIATNQILAPYTPNASELQRDGGVYTYFGSANFDFSNNTRFAGNQYFAAMPPALYALNVGGNATSSFAADNLSYLTGTTSTNSSTDTINTSSVIGPMPTPVYQSARTGSSFTYTLGGFAAGSTHTVTLGFADTSSTAAGQRVFNVTANGASVLNNFDIFASAGGKDAAINETFTVTADANGNIALAFSSVTGLAELSGLEIF